MTDDTFLTTEEVIDYLQVNLRTVYRLIKAGKIPAVRVNRSGASGRAISTPGSRRAARRPAVSGLPQRAAHGGASRARR
jgi:excisionase family DNA binding protein